MIPSEITIIGGAHIDRRGRIFGDTVPAASNPGCWIEEAGGGGFNAACALARLGHSPTVISMRGGDAAAQTVEDAAKEAGVVYRPLTFLDRTTPSYTAILSADGNLVIALADMALYDLFTPRRLQMRDIREQLGASSLVLTDANLPTETLTALGDRLKELSCPLAAVAISPAKVVRFRPSLPNLTFLFMNEAEAIALSGAHPSAPEHWPDIMRGMGLRGGFITRGSDVAIAWNLDEAYRIAPPPVEQIGDVTGAGDAFCAGALHAFSQGAGLAEMLKTGTANARLAVMSSQAAPTQISPQSLFDSAALVPEPEKLA